MRATTRRAFATTAAATAAALTSSGGVAGAADLDAEPIRSRVVRLAFHDRRGSDQWPMAPLGGGDGVYLAGHGDGIGLEVNRSLGRADRRNLGFSRLRITTAGRDGFAVRGEPSGGADIAGYSAASPDDYKPNGIVYDQRSGDLHCFIARGTGKKGSAALSNRRRAWVITSTDRGRSWDVDALPPLGRDPVFDATEGSGLVPVGVCQRPEGSVHDDGRVYVYFNRQGNAKSFDLYPSGGARAALRPVYLARIDAPGGGSAEARAAHFRNSRNYSFWTGGGGWSGGGDAGAAEPVHSPSVYMGKHFLVWWIPRLAKYVAAKTHSVHSVWLGTADRPWGPFATAMDKRLGESRNRGQLKFTAQLLPSPAIADGDETVFPLVVSGAPYYDCLGLAAVEFERD